MKKVIAIALISTFLIGTFITVLGFENNLPFDNLAPDPKGTVTTSDLIRVVVDGKPVVFQDQNPLIKNDRTLVPLRAIFEALDSEVTWDDNTKTVTGKKGSITVILKIGDKNATVNGKNVALDQPAEIIGDRTMVPVRFISESIGCTVSWLDASRIIVITSGTSEGMIVASNTNQNIDTNVDIDGIRVNPDQPTAVTQPSETKAPVKTDENVVSVIDNFNAITSLDKWLTYPATVANNVKVEFDKKEMPSEVANNTGSVKLTFNPDSEKVKDLWMFYTANINAAMKKYKEDGAQNVSFWIKGNTDKIDSEAFISIAVRAKGQSSSGEEKEVIYYAKLNKFALDKKWQKVTIPLKFNGTLNNYDISTGFFADYKDYYFDVDDILSVRFIMNTKDKNGKANTFFNPISVWIDEVEFVK